MSIRVVCNYCRGDAELVDKCEGYGGKVWLCRPCRAWVPASSISPTSSPLGTLAKPHLRGKRTHALRELAYLRKFVAAKNGWRTREATNPVRSWLALEMRISEAECNIYAFDEVKTQIVIDICRNVQVVKVAA